MRVIFFTGHYFPHIGGVEKYTKELATRLEHHAIECRIVTNRLGRIADQPTEELSVVRLPALSLFHNEFPLTMPSVSLWKLIHEVQAWKPDLIVTNTRYFVLNAIATFCNQHWWRAKHIHIEHGSGFVYLNNPVFRMIAKIYDRFLGTYVLKKADYRVGVSLAVNTFLRNSFHIQCDDVLYNAVNASDGESHSENFRTLLHIRTQDDVIGFAGRLIPEKGVMILLQSFQELRNSRAIPPSSHLVIAGKGPLEKAIYEAAMHDAHVHYLGSLSAAAMNSFYQTIDIFAFPTYYPEGFPTVLLEAGIRKKFIIATYRGSAREIIPDVRFGKLIEEKNIAALKKALVDCMNGDVDIRAAGSRLRARIRSQFTWEVTVAKFLSIALSLLKEHA